MCFSRATAAVPCGLSSGWFVGHVGLGWIGWLLVMNGANVHIDPDFGILISMAKCTRVYERPKLATLGFPMERCYSYGLS